MTIDDIKAKYKPQDGYVILLTNGIDGGANAYIFRKVEVKSKQTSEVDICEVAHSIVHRRQVEDLFKDIKMYLQLKDASPSEERPDSI